MDRVHTGENFDPLLPNMDLGEFTRLKCECVSRDTYEELRNYMRIAQETATHLEETLRNDGESAPITTAKDVRARQIKLKELLDAIHKAQMEIKTTIANICDDRKTFGRQVAEQIKKHAINVPPDRPPLVITPHKVGTGNQTKPSKEAFLKRNAPEILPVSEIGGLAQLEEPEIQENGNNIIQSDT